MRYARTLVRHWPLLLVPIAAAAAARGLWAPDEPRYGQVAREVWDGHIFVLRLCGDVYPDKPPLLFWLAALCGAGLEFAEFALRLPSLAATATTAACIGAIAISLGDRRVATLAPAIYLTFEHVLEKGHRLQTDPLLTALATAAIAVSLSTRNRRSGLVVAGALTGMAALTKGPVAWFLVGSVVLLTTRGRPRHHPSTIALACGLAIFPVAAWASLAILLEPNLADNLLWQEHGARMFSADSHPGPLGKQLVLLLAFSMPWTPLWIVGAALQRRTLLGRTAFAWLSVHLAFFTLLAEKRADYLQPAYPAAALLAAHGLTHARTSALWMWPGPLTLGLLAVCMSVPTIVFDLVLLGEPMSEALERARVGIQWTPILGLPALAASVAAMHAAARRHRTQWFRWTVVSTWLSALAVVTFGAPAFDDHKCARKFAEQLASRSIEPTVVPMIGVRPEAYRFYGRLPATNATLDQLLAAAARDRGNFLALVEDDHIRIVADALGPRVQIEPAVSVGSRRIHVLTAPATETGAHK